MPSSIAAVSSTNQIPLTSGQAPVRFPKKVLGQEDFLKLLSVQFQTQDPMKPLEDTAFIAQMAQFTSLAQTDQLAKDMGAMRSDQANATAASLLGRNVTINAGLDSNKNQLTVTGDVTGVDTSGRTPQLLINGNLYPLSALLGVRQASAATTPVPAPTT
ncbi:MAG: flagellar hook assembly protein FlgD [Opitutae bacterium]|nr:flagellar hook assembly protein FlgD [Opitutae bacterium]